MPAKNRRLPEKTVFVSKNGKYIGKEVADIVCCHKGSTAVLAVLHG